MVEQTTYTRPAGGSSPSGRTVILGKQFYERDARIVARELLGKYLVRKRGKKTLSYKILETEAYIGPHDKASHAHKGRTKRTEVMFGPPGHWYVYFTYGIHHMLNVVTREEGYPAAVLIRGVEGISGPGRLTKALGITLIENTKPVTRATGLWIEDRGEKVRQRDILRTPRIGIGYAEEWVGKPYRYLSKDTR